MKLGIQARVLVTTTCVLVTFLSLTGWVLDRSFRASILAGAEDQLQLVIYSLMGAAEEYGEQVRFGPELPEPRLSQAESGLYAAVYTEDGVSRWRSPSAVTTSVRFPQSFADLAPGDARFEDVVIDSAERFYLANAVIWEAEDAAESLLIFAVATDQAPFQAAISGFRRNLYFGLGAVTLLFVLAQLVAVRWGLRPLRTMADEVEELEAGRREALGADYPTELSGLAANLDRFIEHEQRSRARYRTAMEDLAHSLKTPLAVLRNALSEEASGQEEKVLLREQLDRMETTVTHQLSRAAVAGPTVVGRAIELAPLLDRIMRALQHAYVDRGIDVQVEVNGNCVVRGDERDVMEIFGNVLENAFKYTAARVRIEASRAGDVTSVAIEDDGPGIAATARESVLARGTRADVVQPGQGIGLAVVRELVELYKGSLEIGESVLGGARVVVSLP